MALGANAENEEERSLRDDLSAALKDIEARESAAPDDEGAKAPEAQTDTEATETQSDRGDGRDAHGRFVKKGEDSPEASSSEGSAQPSAQKPQDQQQEAQAEAQPSLATTEETDAPPKSWRTDEAAAWKDLPATAKAAILRREADAAKLAGANDAERTFGREFAEIVRPHMPVIQQFGVTPQQAVKGLLESDRLLRSSTPEEKIAHARRLCMDYGIDVQALAQPDPNMPSDPVVAQLQSEVNRLKQQLGQPVQQQQFAPLPPSVEESNIQSEIEAFRSNPAHPHFDAVATRMGQLLETGAAPDLETAYHAAVAMDPALRSTALQPQRTQQEKTAAARQAAASVTGSPGPTGNPKPQSLRDELREQMRSAGFGV